MDRNPSLSRTHGLIGPLQTHRNTVMAAALLQLHTRLRASTSTVYLMTGGAHALAAAMSVDTPLSFTVVPEMAADDPWYTTSRAHQTGKLVAVHEDYVRKQIQEDPALVLRLPFPVFVVSAPLRTAHHRFGALNMRWIPPRDVDSEELQYLSAATDDLAHLLEMLAEQGASMEAPVVPLFISGAHDQPSRLPATAQERVKDRWEEPTGSATTGSTFLYQLLRLASELTAAVSTRDVMASAQTRLVRPFGGRGVMLCMSERGRLHVVGSVGFPKAAVQRVDGMALSRRSPEADAVGKIEPLFFESAQDLHSAYPGLEQDEAVEAQAFLPLISNGRAVGCCILGFDRHRQLGYDERAVLMVTMEQVGQALERARAYELTRARAQGLQQSLLPRSLPHLSQIEITARYLPSTAGADVGGDWYDVITLADGRVGLVIGDVEGHSLEAAGIMGQMRTAVRAYAAEGHDPSSTLSRSNRLLAQLETDLFVTCCCMWLDLSTGAALVASAGHPAPVLSDTNGHVNFPHLPVGPPLGIGQRTLYQQTEIELPPGGIVALFTGGLLDVRRDGTDAAIGLLGRHLAESSTENLEIVADRLIAVSRPEALRDDDVALLLMRYQGAQAGTHRRVAQFSLQRHDLQGVRRLRHLLRDRLHEWDLDVYLNELELLASEMVTNALIHAHSEVDVRLREYPDRIRVEVRDSDPHPPAPVWILGTDEAENQEAESGRGLLIVDAVASAWGSSPAGRGKTTWFELRTPLLSPAATAPCTS